MSPLTPLKTPEEAEPYMGLSAGTLRQMAKANKIQCTRPGDGKKIFFSDDDIIANRKAWLVKPGKPALVEVDQRKAA